MRTSLAVTAVLSALTLAGCGSEGGTASDPATSGPSGQPATSGATGTSGPSGSITETGIQHPTGPDDVVLRIRVGGGFVPPEYAFTNQPTLLLTGDGRLIVPAAGDDAFGDRIVAMDVVLADETLVQEILAAADEHGLLAPPRDYDLPEGQGIADAPTTTVTVTAGGGTFEHSAYALSFDGGDDDLGTGSGARADLAAFIDEAIALVPAGGEPYAPEQLRLLATDSGIASGTGGVPQDARVRDWPEDDVDLATAGDCTLVDAGDLVDLLAAADSQTYFRQDGVVYSVSAAEVLPGDAGCGDAS